jgi:FkbM family methyltransferase
MGEPDFLPRLSRRLASVKGLWRIANRIQNRFPASAIDPSDRIVTIDDYDGDLKLRFDKGSHMGNYIYWQGFYSRSELMALEAVLKPDSVFIDVGANNGYFTLFAAKRTRNGRVLSFEPVSTYFSNMEHNVELNQFENVELFNIGLSDGTAEELPIYSDVADENRDGLATIYPGGHRNTQIGTIKLSSLDRVAAEQKLVKVDVIKIDVEGAEFDVLKGGRSVLERWHPAILIELSRETSSNAGYSVKDVMDYLGGFGYAFKRIGNNGTLTDLETENMPAFCNAMCIAEGAAL